MDLRSRILAAAGRLYCEHGFRGTTTRLVASEAGVNEITVFRQFGSKEHLLREAISRNWAEVDCPMPPEQPREPAAELTAWALAFTAKTREAAPLIRMCLGEFEQYPEILPPGGSPTARAAGALANCLVYLRERGVTSVTFDPPAAAAMLVGALFTDAITREGLPDMYSNAADDDVRLYVQVFLRGLGVPA